MNERIKNRGFTLLEIIVVVAVLAILASLVVGVGRRLREQAEERLAKGAIDIIVLALDEYYSFHGKYPFEAIQPYISTDLKLLDDLTDGTSDGIDGTVGGTGTHNDLYSSSEALFYFLDNTPTSRGLIRTISATLISNKGDNGLPLTITITGSSSAIDLVRFIDPWGKSLRYTYDRSTDSFPLVESAGVDGDFTTVGDNISSK
ncbi:MAG: type II secretion system protein [Planctomycetes bacterium]|nr:type II secretion system protein [Planctomycetota bacterium]